MRSDHTVQFLRTRRRRRQRLTAIAVSGVLLGYSGTSFVQAAQATPTTAGTNVDVVLIGGANNGGLHFNVTVDGPVSLVIAPTATISAALGCVGVYGEAGPHQSGYPIGADCTGPGVIAFDTITYPDCDQHLYVLADGVDLVYDVLIGSGNCGPFETTTTTEPPTTTTVAPPTTTRALNARYCTRRATKGGRACQSWNCPAGPDPKFCLEP